MKRNAFLTFILASLIAFIPSLHAQAAQRIFILRSGDLAPFEQAIEGFKKGLRDAHVPAETSEHDISEGMKLLESAKQFSPDLIVALGSTATRFAKEQFPNTPTVFSMVLYPSLTSVGGTQLSPYITGVAMDIPIDKQFQTIQRIIPSAKKIGVLYNPNETGKVIQQAQGVAKGLAMELLGVPVKSEREVPAALNGIEQRVDVLWSVADSTVFSGKMPEYILQYTLQHDLPFVGLSPSFADAGALFALSQDYADIGQQTAELAIRVLAGAKPGDLPVVYPRRILLSLNLRAAEEIGLKIPAEIIHSASKVIQ